MKNQAEADLFPEPPSTVVMDVAGPDMFSACAGQLAAGFFVEAIETRGPGSWRVIFRKGEAWQNRNIKNGVSTKSEKGAEDSFSSSPSRHSPSPIPLESKPTAPAFDSIPNTSGKNHGAEV